MVATFKTELDIVEFVITAFETFKFVDEIFVVLIFEVVNPTTVKASQIFTKRVPLVVPAASEPTMERELEAKTL